MSEMVTNTIVLSSGSAERLLASARDAARRIGVPQCIAIVDSSGDLLAFLRMEGAKPMSIATAQAKAVTAARTRSNSGPLPDHIGLTVSLATGGSFTELRGGRVFEVDGTVVGAIGVGSGTPEQDEEVADAAVVAFVAGLQD